MSGAPIISGTNQLPKPPIIAGMTMKKIISRAWALITTFHHWPSGASDVPKSWMPGWPSS